MGAPLRDSSILQIGKTPVLCEIGDASWLSERRNKYYDRMMNEVLDEGKENGGGNAPNQDQKADEKETLLPALPEAEEKKEKPVEVEEEKVEDNKESSAEPATKKRRWDST